MCIYLYHARPLGEIVTRLLCKCMHIHLHVPRSNQVSNPAMLSLSYDALSLLRLSGPRQSNMLQISIRRQFLQVGRVLIRYPIKLGIRFPFYYTEQNMFSLANFHVHVCVSLSAFEAILQGDKIWA